MDLTTNLGLKKPAGTDHYSVDDFNENMDKLDLEIAKKVDKEAGKGLSSNDYTNNEKAKLELLHNYELPQASEETIGGIKVDGTTITVDDDGIASAVPSGYTLPASTVSALGGVMVDDITIKINASGVINSTLINNLTQSTVGVGALDANQGKILKGAVDLKVATSDIVDNLTSTDAVKPLSANQGYILKTAVDLKASKASFVLSGTTLTITM